MSLPTPYYDQDGITIIHADCRDILPMIQPATVDLVLTDPPYGDNHDTDYTRFSGGKTDKGRKTYRGVADDDVPFDPSGLLSIGRRVIAFGANRYSDRLPVGSWLVWDKRTPTGSKGVMSDAEVAWMSHGRGVYIFSHTWDGFNRASERRTSYHPTQKPVALMRWIIERWSKPGDLILDPYMGSGPIAQACSELGRHYIGIELDEQYCEIAVKRLQQALQPELIGGAA